MLCIFFCIFTDFVWSWSQQMIFPRKLFRMFFLMEAQWVFVRWELAYLFTYLRTHLLPHSMEQSPSSEANRFSGNSLHFMEPEGSLPHSQVPATCSCLEPDQCSPYPHIPLPWRSCLILSSHLRLGLPNFSFPCYMPRLSDYSWFDHPKVIESGVQIIKLVKLELNLYILRLQIVGPKCVAGGECDSSWNCKS